VVRVDGRAEALGRAFPTLPGGCAGQADDPFGPGLRERLRDAWMPTRRDGFASVFVTAPDGLRLHVRRYGSRIASALATPTTTRYPLRSPTSPPWDPESRNGTPFKEIASGFAGLHISALPTGKRECIISLAASAPGVRDVESKKMKHDKGDTTNDSCLGIGGQQETWPSQSPVDFCSYLFASSRPWR
jgi:hypothetical protein